LKSPFADGGEVERRYIQQVGWRKPTSLCRYGTSVTRVKYDVQSSEGHWQLHDLVYSLDLGYTFIHLKLSARSWTVFHTAQSPTVVHCTAAEQGSYRGHNPQFVTTAICELMQQFIAGITTSFKKVQNYPLNIKKLLLVVGHEAESSLVSSHIASIPGSDLARQPHAG